MYYQVGWYPFLSCLYPSTRSVDFGPLCNPSLSHADNPHWHPLFANLQAAFKFRLDSVGWLALRWSSFRANSSYRTSAFLVYSYLQFLPPSHHILASTHSTSEKPDMCGCQNCYTWLSYNTHQEAMCMIVCPAIKTDGQVYLWVLGKLYSSRDVPTRAKFAALTL